MATLHVATDGADAWDGSASRPFRTINRAAELAQPGDTVIVHEGEYREWVRPRRGGLSGTRRITYQAAPGEHVVIKGSEPVAGWERETGAGPGTTGTGGTVWRASVPNALFGDWNPFAQEVEVVDEGDEVYLEARLPAAFGRVRLGVVTGADLPRVRFADADFEERDGSPAVIDVDQLGERKEPGHDYPADPIASLCPGTSRIRVW